jgi:hypothetical protein
LDTIKAASDVIQVPFFPLCSVLPLPQFLSLQQKIIELRKQLAVVDGEIAKLKRSQ